MALTELQIKLLNYDGSDTQKKKSLHVDGCRRVLHQNAIVYLGSGENFEDFFHGEKKVGVRE
jgi:hypothetical protein